MQPPCVRHPCKLRPWFLGFRKMVDHSKHNLQDISSKNGDSVQLPGGTNQKSKMQARARECFEGRPLPLVWWRSGPVWLGAEVPCPMSLRLFFPHFHFFSGPFKTTMTSVNELYPHIQKLKNDLQFQLREVEAKRMSHSDLQIGLDALGVQAAQLERLAEKEVNRRDEWRAKVREIVDTQRWLEERLQRWRRHHDKAALEDSERRELLGRCELPSSVIAALDEEGESLSRSTNVVSSLIENASASMSELASQREMLKGTQRRVLDMLTTLGVSSSTIRVIERRNVVDRAIVFGGMVVVTFCLFLLWRWVR
jgi:golgi SNAP receptor complex member 2